MNTLLFSSLRGRSSARTAARTAALTAALMLCAGLAAVPGAFAAEVNRCVDVEGKVLLTDAPCPQGAVAVAIDRSAGEAADGVSVSVSDSGAVGIVINTGGIERVAPHVSGGALPRSRWADLPRALIRKSVTTDAMTLQAARARLLSADESRRQTRMLASR